jgi:hypothetical protein
LFKIGLNLAADLSGHSTFYSALFELFGQTIGQWTTLTPLLVEAPGATVETKALEGLPTMTTVQKAIGRVSPHLLSNDP